MMHFSLLRSQAQFNMTEKDITKTAVNILHTFSHGRTMYSAALHHAG